MKGNKVSRCPSGYVWAINPSFWYSRVVKLERDIASLVIAWEMFKLMILDEWGWMTPKLV
jgi:hypothetical protein